MDQHDQRDYAEEDSNRNELEREGIAELQDEALDVTTAYREWHINTLGSKHREARRTATPRKNFTAMSPAGIVEVLLRMEDSGESYPMFLNHRDFWNLLIALRHLHDDPSAAPDLQEWAASFISDIGETFNVEFV